ncbi:hypothetical protein COP2_028482 [Malus domestica]
MPTRPRGSNSSLFHYQIEITKNENPFVADTRKDLLKNAMSQRHRTGMLAYSSRIGFLNLSKASSNQM